MSIEAYRENLAEAKQELRIASERMRRLEEAGYVFWGTIPRRDLPDYVGWCIKGGRGTDADKAFTAWARCKSDVEPWMRLLAEERVKYQAPDPRLPPERDDEEAA